MHFPIIKKILPISLTDKSELLHISSRYTGEGEKTMINHPLKQSLARTRSPRSKHASVSRGVRVAGGSPGNRKSM